MKVDKLTVSWKHYSTTVERTSIKGNTIKSLKMESRCFIHSGEDLQPICIGIFIHPINKYNKSKGILESFKRAVSHCPLRPRRTQLWDAFWAIRKPTIIVSEPTADLLSCVDYVGHLVKANLQLDDVSDSNVEWRAMARPNITKAIASKLTDYRNGSNYSLIHIMKWAMIGFINYKRLKDATKSTS